MFYLYFSRIFNAKDFRKIAIILNGNSKGGKLGFMALES
jgi:hypothetical protein